MRRIFWRKVKRQAQWITIMRYGVKKMIRDGCHRFELKGPGRKAVIRVHSISICPVHGARSDRHKILMLGKPGAIPA
ncbi:Uncharacterised protein [Chlamydia abortus]|nr:Uncharacterised protein [Chlamydia abortus]